MQKSDASLSDFLPPNSKDAVSGQDPEFDPSPSAATSNTRQLRTTWIAVVSLLAVVGMFVLLPGLRSLPGDTWREGRSVRPVFLFLIILFKVIQALFSAVVWRNALGSAWPKANLSYRYVLGVDQGQDAVNTILPGRAGTWGMLGIFVLSIPGARFSTMLAVYGVQSLAFFAFSMINYAVIATLLPQRTQASGGLGDRLSDLATMHPIATGIVLALFVVVLVAVTIAGRRKINEVKHHLAEGFAVLRSPGRYFRLIAFPSLLSYGARAAANAALLAAFGIPVTVSTMALALGSRAAAGALRFTPGGLGTTQALEVVALRDYAPADVVTAYSLVDLALSTIVSIGIAIPALVSANGWKGTKSLAMAAVGAPPVTESASDGQQTAEVGP